MQERNLAESRGEILWLRTCYKPRLATVYTEMTEIYVHIVGNARLAFNDETLYSDLGKNLTKLYIRAPQLPTFDEYLESQHFTEEQPEDESMVPLWNSSINERLFIYLLDEEVLRRKMIKLTWFGLGGELL